jgi:carbon-monoxide dehydrogenase medium subunit
MQAFAYVPTTTLAEAIAILTKEGEHARVLSGGTDLLVQLREGRRRVGMVVDVKRIPELNELAYDPMRGLHIGAAVPCYRIYGHPAIAAAYPGLIDAASLIGGVQIQGRATLGGNLCNASPAADSIPALIAYQAVCVVAGNNGTREIRVEDFCTAPGRTMLQTGELLVALQLPPPPPHSGAAYLRFIPRNEMDIAVAGVGASVQLDESLTRILAARIALGAVAPRPLYVPEAGQALSGQPLSETGIAEAARIAQSATQCISDMRGSAAQRVHLTGVLTRRALHKAIERARVAVTA